MQLSKKSHIVKSAALESLEERRMLINQVDLLAGYLFIYGTTSSDNVVVSKSGTNLKVVLNAKTYTFPAAGVNKVVANLKEGDDKFTSDNSVTKPMNVDGNFGRDTITTGGGADSIFSGNEDDKVIGGDGDDTIHGGSGNDTIYGNNGGDSLEGASGNDSVFGGAGYDMIDAAGYGADFYDGGDDDDTILYRNRTISGVAITNDGIANDGTRPASGFNSLEKDNVLPNIERIDTTEKDDRIKLTGNFNNVIFVYGGKDSVDSGPGNDNIVTGPGSKTIMGGSGNDRIFTSTGSDVIDGGDGNDQIRSGDNFDIVYAGNGDDSIDGGAGGDMLFGEAGKDTINGGDGSDYIDGGENNDSLIGDAGNDNVHGQAGNDFIAGGSGFDSMFGESGNDHIFSNDFVFGERVDGGIGSDFAFIDKYTSQVYTPGDVLINVESWLG